MCILHPDHILLAVEYSCRLQIKKGVYYLIVPTRSLDEDGMKQSYANSLGVSPNRIQVEYEDSKPEYHS